MTHPTTLLGPIALAEGILDRLAHRRLDQEWLDQALSDASSRMVCVSPGRILTSGGRPSWLPTRGVTPDETQAWVLLGQDEDAVVRFALLHRPDHAQSESPKWVGLRDIAGQLSARDGAAAAAAVALANWHAAHPCCSRCGQPTQVGAAGWTRHCVADGSEHYPRTDPAVIMAAVDEQDRILLGRGATWPENRYSTLAGFVEPGETLEDAVRREVAEEVGVTVGEVTYLGSQPWPFPASLMIGCQARAVTTDITIDPAEIAAAQWFSREELNEAVAAGAVVFPPSSSISRRLIQRWYGAELPSA